MKMCFVGPKGGSVDIVDKATGEVLRSLPVAPGSYPVARFARYLFSNEALVLPGVVLATQGNTETCKPVGQFESAANPSFRMSPAARQLRDMKTMLARSEALAKRTEKAARAIARAKAAQPVKQITAEVSAPVLPATGDAV